MAGMVASFGMDEFTTTTLDQGGRVVIPKKLRLRYGLSPGSRVHLVPGADSLAVVPERATRRFVEHGAVLAIVTGEGTAPLSAFDVDDVRAEQLEGKSGADWPR